MRTDTTHGIELLKIAHKLTQQTRKNQCSAEGRIKYCLMKWFCLVSCPQLPSPTVQWFLQGDVCVFSSLWIYRCLNVVNHVQFKHPFSQCAQKNLQLLFWKTFFVVLIRINFTSPQQHTVNNRGCSMQQERNDPSGLSMSITRTFLNSWYRLLKINDTSLLLNNVAQMAPIFLVMEKVLFSH